MSDKPKLLDQVCNSLRQPNYSYSTERTYISWIKWFILYHNQGSSAVLSPLDFPPGTQG
ncbi:MAG: phage integrase N-terminal SAM-like domain-containing protein [Anaerolineales bacterium]